MRRIELDGRRMDTRAAAWAYLRQELSLPEYFGNNLDALADCLGEMGRVSITLRCAVSMVNALGSFGLALLEVFENAASKRTDMVFRTQNR
jgi:ribonuclease inhibitor